MALIHIKTDGTENGLTGANKINACFNQSDANLALIETKVSKTGDTMTGNLTVGIAESFAQLKVQPFDELGASSVRLENSTGDKYFSLRHDIITDTTSIIRGNDIEVEAVLVLRPNGNVAINEGVAPSGDSDLTPMFYVDSANEALLVLINGNTQTIINNTEDIETNIEDIAINTANIITNTNDIAGNTTNITTNTDDILTNTNAITANTLNINDLDTRVTTLEDVLPFTYAFDSATNILDVGETDQAIVNVTELSAVIGRTYELKWSAHYNIAAANDVVYFRYRQDGGTWIELNEAAKTIDDELVISYFYPFIATTTTISFEVEARKGDGGSDFDIYKADVIIEQKT